MSEEQHILAYLAEGGPAGWAFVARTLQTRHPGRPAPKYTVLVELEKRGLVERAVIEETPNVVYTITADGRAFLERFPPPTTEQRGPWLMTEHSARPAVAAATGTPAAPPPAKGKKSKK